MFSDLCLIPSEVSWHFVNYTLFNFIKGFTPKIKKTPNAKEYADKELHQMGSFSISEKVMSIIFIVALLLYIKN
ncbi:anion permease [Liquorilactobacillus mali]|uniref:anion permease n=1 Tax=Liquorilactobacillus mali TaxID=1618 RepID=UPI003AF31AD7